MILRFGPVALASAFLLGCQTMSPEKQWTKAGATTEDVKRDLYWCTVQRRDPRAGTQTPATERPPTREVDEVCMESRGYSKVDSKS